MKTYAAVKEVKPTRLFDGRDYVERDNGQLIRTIGEKNGRHYALYAVAGKCVKEHAYESAEKNGAFVVVVQTPQWPETADIFAAIPEVA
jgi:hypothetical protein